MQNKTPIAVVGMAGLFPGAADLDTYWQNIINKADAAAEVPEDRWIVNPNAIHDPVPAPDKAYSKRACLINNFTFDPSGFNIDKNLLNALDPLYHMVLHVGREAFSGIYTSSLDAGRIGTILAAIALPTDTSSTVTREIIGTSFKEKLFGSQTSAAEFTINKTRCLSSRVTSLPAAILARALGLGGGSFTLDAACASSLYAVKLACDELQHHRADAMLAGGVSRPECLYTQVGFSQLRALSPTGRCAPFDETANGLVVGEGAGILVLKRLDDALRDENTIFGLIRAIGLSNDLGGNLLSPDSEGQVRAMRKAYNSAGWSPSDVDLIECHGAGTPLGDLTELKSLTLLWDKYDWQAGQCAIGSVKSMIGHLLTAAGAAGMIKTLLAMRHHTLPPSLNFSKPPAGSPLVGSPFRVQTSPQEWIRKDSGRPLRSAVSAFGFGGINAHLLFEEWLSGAGAGFGSFVKQPLKEKPTRNIVAADEPCTAEHYGFSDLTVITHGDPVAIIGMDISVGSLKSLQDFQETVLSGNPAIAKRPQHRWKGSDSVADRYLTGRSTYGSFMDELTINIGEFRIPPNEIPDIIPQHLLMLKVAAGAMKNAGLQIRNDRPDMSVLIGMGFDFEATNFHLRWHLYNLVRPWIDELGLDLNKRATLDWLESLRNASGPPLTATRTLGALGGIIASRIAREFRLGGPSFVISGEEASGLKALEIGVRALQQNEIDTALVGAVDMAGDVRNIITSNPIRPYTKRDTVRPFDQSSDGTLPGEGAVAVVLKRLKPAISAGHRIYAVIRGIGSAGGGGIDLDTSKESYQRSLNRAFQEAAVSPRSVSFAETHGSGYPPEDNMETEALHAFFSGRTDSGRDACAIGSLKPIVGHTGAAAGLMSVAKTSLCLFHEILPPLSNFVKPATDIWQKGPFHIPRKPQYWLRNRKDGPRRACAAAVTTDGNCMHIVLEQFEPAGCVDMDARGVELAGREKQKPLGYSQYGLFVIEGDSRQELLSGLKELDRHVRQPKNSNRKSEQLARRWFQQVSSQSSKKYALSIVSGALSRLPETIKDAKLAVLANTAKRTNGPANFYFSPEPLGPNAELAYVFPGSGNHYVGMGREIGVQWPDVLRRMDAGTLQLKAQMLPHLFVPWRTSWEPGWESDAEKAIVSDPLNMIFGQVVHGAMMADLMKAFDIQPAAVIGYSLGESAGLFALGAWPDRGKMLERMLATDLFTTELAGPCNAARKIWDIPPDEAFNWCAAVVNRPAGPVKAVIKKWPHVKLLIVNTPDECVIGGRKNQVDAAVRELRCDAVYLAGVVSVHCEAVTPVAEAYRQLHIFPMSPPAGLRCYSCAMGKSYELTSDSAADSILNQALKGFDYPATIRQAYQDGVRIFLELGPHASCTRMISSILSNRPHLAVSACVRGEDGHLTILKCLGALIAERVPLNLAKLYGSDAYARRTTSPIAIATPDTITLAVGTPLQRPELPYIEQRGFKSPKKRVSAPPGRLSSSPAGNRYSEFIEPMKRSMAEAANAHQRFLDFSNQLQQTFAETYDFQARLLKKIISDSSTHATFDEKTAISSESHYTDTAGGLLARKCPQDATGKPAFSRKLCMEFATGSVARVLGPEFAPVDTYKTRVRLPDEPLMLVDRILSIEGEKGSLGSGSVVTEHDVLPGAWYLDGDRAPVCISVEAGQADLFLCAYLGIDLHVKGERAYRLLDASVQFHRGLPKPGDVIRYEIRIEKFVRQGETYLFFFNFDGFVGNSHLISMTNGCAGFFTPEEVLNSGGIIAAGDEMFPGPARTVPEVPTLKSIAPVAVERYDDAELRALREGDPAGCFGGVFDGIRIADSLRLPGGRMKLIDRVLSLDPNGGRYGLGLIRAEADIHPNDWFLTCHFMDDMVMPGTLMYECCAHTLRVFVQRMGWLTDNPEACYEPVVGVQSVLKCRGPVTPETSHVVYEVEIKEIGYEPEPYVIADAHMYADNRYIVDFTNLSMKLTGATRDRLEAFWKAKSNKTRFDRNSILAFATGKPSEAFGDTYRVFDRDRYIARLPAPPYSFIDRITAVEPPAWILKPDGWIEAEYDVLPDKWYFRADRSGHMPFCILLEIALQPCGWLAAYAGSALKSEKDLKFRNLGGEAVLHRPVLPDTGRMTMRTRLKRVSEAGEMIIEHFDFRILNTGAMVYEGNTYFGFFTRKALANQVGIRGVDMRVHVPDALALENPRAFVFQDEAPLSPADPDTKPAPNLTMPAKAIRMIDAIDAYIPDGGPLGLGFIRGIKSVNPDEWFFKAHFYQDPVCPGSLGIESFLQLIKFAALERWGHLTSSHCFIPITELKHQWTYRGQILPQHQKIEVEAEVIRVTETPYPEIVANGLLKVDGIYIYQMENFGFRLLPKRDGADNYFHFT